MRSGRLRHRLVLQSKVKATNSHGEDVITWSTETTVWGAIEPLSGREYFLQDQVQAEAQVRIVIRYNASINPTWRVSHGGLFYNIEDVINHDTRNRMMTLMCRQGVSDTQATDATVPANALYDVDGNPLTFVDGEYIQTVD